MRQVTSRHGGPVMHSQHTGVMLIGPGGDSPALLTGEHRRVSWFQCRQRSAVKYQQVRRSFSMAKADESDRMATEGKNPATHCLDRSDAWGDVGQRDFAF